jgi:hypothetical protein
MNDELMNREPRGLERSLCYRKAGCLQTGHIARRPCFWSHLVMQARWNWCMHGSAIIQSPSE